MGQAGLERSGRREGGEAEARAMMRDGMNFAPAAFAGMKAAEASDVR